MREKKSSWVPAMIAYGVIWLAIAYLLLTVMVVPA